MRETRMKREISKRTHPGSALRTRLTKRPAALKTLAALSLALLLCGTLASCAGMRRTGGSGTNADAPPDPAALSTQTAGSGREDAASFRIGLCSGTDDASQSQIVENILSRLDAIGQERNASFTVLCGNSNGDEAVLSRIIANMTGDGVDLLAGVSTPVAAAMQRATEESGLPVVFSAVSAPLRAQLISSNEEPGGNLTGVSDSLDTEAVLRLIFTVNPNTARVGLLYDQEQTASAASIDDAKAWLMDRGVGIVERTGSTDNEVMLAAKALTVDGVDAVFTPTDSTILSAERSICETFTEAGIPHYAGADAFALGGAFVGYGVDYADLGAETAEMVCEILLDGANPAETPVRTPDNSIAVINTETCAALGMEYETVEAALSPLCSRVSSITTADSFHDLEK